VCIEEVNEGKKERRMNEGTSKKKLCA
jgi:hypothetical protein